MPGYRDLVAWKKAMELVIEIYSVTQGFPKEERYGLVSQLRRAAVSVPSNLAEGYGRNSPSELHQFIGHARGSLAEVETQIDIAHNLGYLKAETTAQLQARVAHLGRMITGLRAWSERIAT